MCRVVDRVLDTQDLQDVERVGRRLNERLPVRRSLILRHEFFRKEAVECSGPQRHAISEIVEGVRGSDIDDGAEPCGEFLTAGVLLRFFIGSTDFTDLLPQSRLVNVLSGDRIDPLSPCEDKGLLNHVIAEWHRDDPLRAFLH